MQRLYGLNPYRAIALSCCLITKYVVASAMNDSAAIAPGSKPRELPTVRNQERVKGLRTLSSRRALVHLPHRCVTTSDDVNAHIFAFIMRSLTTFDASPLAVVACF